MIKLTINNVPVEVPKESTVLEAARAAGVRIPTFCYLEKLHGIGACRVCLVEVEGLRDMVASCVMPAAEGMVVYTNTKRVRNARKTVVELLLSEHSGECQTCNRNDDCELQSLARELGIDEVRYQGQKTRQYIDTSTAGLVRDAGKCVMCRRCVTVCNEVQGVGALFPQGRGFSTAIGPAFASDLADVTCIQCGQCAAVCPVGAISEKDEVDLVWAALDDPEKTVVVQTAPAIRAALGECFDYPPGTLVTGKMTTALQRLGFDAVFDTDFSADLTIMEEGTELLTRLKKALVDKDASVALPMFTSCSPGWIAFAEHFYPDFLPNLSTCKSPQQMMGALIKTYYAQKIGKKPEDIVSVSIMPCTAKKYEARRPEMNDSGVQDVDIVLTTRELGRMIKQANIDFRSLPDSEMDAPLGLSTGAADIFANTGGVMEAALRTVYEIVTGRELPVDNLHVREVAGLDGIKEASLTIEGAVKDWSFLEGVTVKVAVAHSLGNARKLIEAVKAGEVQYHFVEVMTCPGGCIGGGGQPRMTNNAVREARIAAIYKEDEGREYRKSHENPQIDMLYKEYLGKPLGEKSHHLLHTKYTQRELV
ncbi:MAG: 2Fe-2S iron-sulfur cluster binding domain-containing protein [Spartobacteria bacterium]|nr:2Fe-2S iron-sulfur cluster binding domain-containing protein [Spartobacteria bacterium]